MNQCSTCLKMGLVFKTELSNFNFNLQHHVAYNYTELV